MDLVLRIFAAALATPVLLVIAVALGPVVLGVICAALFGLLVFAIWSLLLALGLLGRRTLARAGSRSSRGAQAPD